MFITLMSPNREALIQWLNSYGKGELRVAMICCQRTITFLDSDSIPYGDVGPCKCGNWFIKYTDKKVPISFGVSFP